MNDAEIHEFIGSTKASIANIERTNKEHNDQQRLDFDEVKVGIKNFSDKLEKAMVTCPLIKEVNLCNSTRMTTKDRRYIIGAMTIIFGVMGFLYKVIQSNTHEIMKYLKP